MLGAHVVASMASLASLVLAAGAACTTARPQNPEPRAPEQGVVPAGPPAPEAPPPSTTTVPAVDEQQLMRLDIACQNGPITLCAEVVRDLAGAELPPHVRVRVAFEEVRIAAWGQVDARAIGVVLPLSGPYAKYGVAAKEAIDLALAGHGPSLQVIVRDSAGDAETAARLATDLVLQAHVAAVLGPIGRKESAAVASVARFFQVPHVPLTSEVPRLDLADDVDPVLRLRTNAEELVAAVARHARTELGSERVAILLPASDAAREAAAAFVAELERLGGTIVREVPFSPEAESFDEAMQALLALEPAPATAGGRPRRPPRKITPDFDTLFIPADAITVRRLAPALAYWGVQPRTVPGDASRVQLVGHAGWNNPVVIDKGEHLTDNAVFADVFAPDDPDAQDFARRFYLRLERRPTAFHAEAWDAARLLIEALAAARAAAQPATREGVRDAFLEPRVLVGATGQVEVVAGGRIRPRAHLMTIDGDEIRRRYPEDEERARRTATIPAERAP